MMMNANTQPTRTRLEDVEQKHANKYFRLLEKHPDGYPAHKYQRMVEAYERERQTYPELPEQFIDVVLKWCIVNN